MFPFQNVNIAAKNEQLNAKVTASQVKFSHISHFSSNFNAHTLNHSYSTSLYLKFKGLSTSHQMWILLVVDIFVT